MYQEVSDGVASFEIHLHPMFPADVLAAFTQALYVWDNYIWLTGVCVVTSVGPLFVVLLVLFDVHSVQSPSWVLTSSQYFIKVLFLFF